MQPVARPPLRLVEPAAAVSQRREFDELARRPVSRVTVEPVETDEISDLLAFAAREIPVLSTATAAVTRVVNRNRESVYVFRRGGRPVGIYAMLHLSKDGLEALLLDEFNTAVPDPHCLVATGEPPVAIYKWAVVAPGPAAQGIYRISHLLQADRYATANLFARPTTAGGERIMRNLGFEKVGPAGRDLHRYVRLANRTGHLVEAE